MCIFSTKYCTCNTLKKERRYYTTYAYLHYRRPPQSHTQWALEYENKYRFSVLHRQDTEANQPYPYWQACQPVSNYEEQHSACLSHELYVPFLNFCHFFWEYAAMLYNKRGHLCYIGDGYSIWLHIMRITKLELLYQIMFMMYLPDSVRNECPVHTYKQHKTLQQNMQLCQCTYVCTLLFCVSYKSIMFTTDI